ncbi:MAG: hypothetical protein PHD32_08365 [Eubacteriales bacterium]|nr:hypothetical protein [Eubacteriales bacterium]
MKKALSICLSGALAVFLLAACTAQPHTPVAQPSSGEPVVLHTVINKVEDGALLVTALDGIPEARGSDLIRVVLQKTTRINDRNGNSCAWTTLAAGQTVDITYGGSMTPDSPAQILDCSRIVLCNMVSGE